MQIIVEDKKIADIPVLYVYNINQTGRLPVIIVFHGKDSHKENNLKPAYKLARAGFFVVLFDALHHGERKNATLDPCAKPENQNLNEIIRIQLDSVTAVAPLVESCRNNPRANPNRVGLMGFSMGGNSVYKFISGTIPEYIKAAAVYSATPCWSAVLRRMATASERVGDINPELISWVESIEPYHTIGRLRDFPLLMVNGVRDEIFPIQGVRDVFNELYPNYNDKERLVQLEYPQAGHFVTDEMLNPAIEWFRRFLK